jgi:hypothetical protein
MTTTHPKAYGFTDLCADIWLGPKLARQIEADAEKMHALVDKKLAKKAKGTTEKSKPKKKDSEKREVRVVPVCRLAPCLYVVSSIFGSLHHHLISL